jgi:signal transduction histidine kinase
VTVTPAPASHDRDLVWRRQLVFWHGIAGVIFGVALYLTSVDDRGPRLASAACVAVIALAYAVWGARGLHSQSMRWGAVYLAVAWPAFLLLIALNPRGDYYFVSFALFPQTWALLSRKVATWTTVAVIAGLTAVRLATLPPTSSTLVAVLVSSAIGLALSLGMGLLIHVLVEEMERRADTIEVLHRTQADLAAAERAQGVFAERERLSREIHDTLAQGFTSVVTLARAADAALERGDVETVRERLALLEQTAAENLAEARLIVAALTPGHLQNGTLAEALQRVVDAAAAESGIAGELTVVGSPGAAPANAEVAVLRTAQEAIANIRRHSGASSFRVRLDYHQSDRIGLEVTDDGRGFDADAVRGGFGLVGAQSRAADLGTELVVDTAPGAGTTLRVSVPR